MGIMLVTALMAVGYWYFGVRASTPNKSPTGAITSGLVGYWTYDGADVSGTTATDRGSVGGNGTLTGGPTVVQGKIGQAINFDGTDDYVSVADNASFDFGDTADFTLTGWFNRDTFTTDDTVVAKRNGITAGDTGYIAYIDDTTDFLVFEVSDGTDEYSVASSVTFAASGWQHFAIVWDQDSATTTEMYINGAKQTGIDTGTIGNIGDLSNALTLRYGAESDAGNPFDGKLDEVRVYSRALATTEIQSLYELTQSDEVNSSSAQAQGSGKLDSGVIAYWPLDESTGATATDSSNSANNATLTNMENGDWVTGQIGNALDFDGTNEYATTSRTIPQRGSFSIWVKSGATLDTSADWYIAFAAVSGNFFVLNASTFTTYNSFCFHMRGGFGTNVTDICGPVFPSTAVFQEWHHLVATWDATKGATLYIDGGAVETTTTGTSAFDAMTLGLSYTDPAVSWLGQLDEARMYNRVLSADEVSQLYRTTAVTPLETSLKGYWAMNGQDVSGTTVFDLSGTGNNGTLTNTPTATAGVVGQAYDFDGSSEYLSVTDAATLDFTTSADFTLSGWFRRESSASDDTVVAKRNGIANTDDGYICYIDDTTDKLTCEMSEAGGTDEFQLETIQTFTDNAWHHFALVWDDDSASGTDIYIDGIATSATETGTITNIGDLSNAVAFRAGAESDAGGPFDGKLDEIRVYSRVLTAAELKAQYEAAQLDKVNTSVSTPQGTGRLDSGLAGYWALDETTGSSASDSSTSGVTGTLTNMENGDWVAAQVGNGLDFDGTDEYVTIADNSLHDFGDTESLTIAGWFNRGTATTDDTIVAKRSGIANTDDGYICYIDDATDQLICEVSESGGTDEYSVTSVSTFTATGWNHFAFVWDQGSATATELYINGVPNNATDSGTIGNLGDLSNSDAFRIGAESDAGNPFIGQLDEMRLYNRALSPDEISQLYRRATPTGTDTGLKGYWSFNGQDISGTTAFDRSGAKNNGTLVNTPTRSIGKLGQGLGFASASTQYVNVGSDASIDDFINLSACAWVKPNSSLTTYGDIIAKFTNAIDGWQMALDFTTLTSLRLSFYRVFDGSDGHWLTSSAISYNQWSHVCVTYNNSSASNDPLFYVNGSAVSSTENTTPTGTASADAGGDAYIGAYNNGGTPGELFNGSLDEVRLYNRILTDTEIAALYNSSR